MAYSVELSPAAQPQARRLSPQDAQRVQDALRNLTDNPRPSGSIKLTGFEAVWRIRVGRLRVIYEIHDSERQLIVQRIARRNEATYRRL
ncbi:MAG: type II toxin-antitoxin system RelE/ParE family toxin [Chloroflexota bacterium]|nr:type II toxin-antitoxin system RelE/ParE family toxin [Chloroflexota bacterium]MDE2961913.1 type II toxin-antitoxin system RelE/ParE family toxin [Chloroflexota bacterium]